MEQPPVSSTRLKIYDGREIKSGLNAGMRPLNFESTLVGLADGAHDARFNRAALDARFIRAALSPSRSELPSTLASSEVPYLHRAPRDLALQLVERLLPLRHDRPFQQHTFEGVKHPVKLEFISVGWEVFDLFTKLNY